MSAADTEVALSVYLELDGDIDAASATDLRARWTFGQVLLTERNGNARLPYGRVKAISEAISKRRQEVFYRLQFAEEYPTKEKLFYAVERFKSWHDYCTQPRTEREPSETPPIPDGVFATITADPPWKYGNTATRGAAEDHYPTLSVEELCALNVDGRYVYECAGDNAHLYLWTTNGFLRESFDVLDAWGFIYKTTLTWVKPQLGIGNYFRGGTEHVLFGVRGSLAVLDSNQPNWFQVERGRHSQKPDRFYELVERVSPGPYLELFARRDMFGARAGWTPWGNEA